MLLINPRHLVFAFELKLKSRRANEILRRFAFVCLRISVFVYFCTFVIVIIRTLLTRGEESKPDHIFCCKTDLCLKQLFLCVNITPALGNSVGY